MASRAYSAHGLILSGDQHRIGLGGDALQRAVLRGELIRLRRGAYCESDHWNELDARQRYLLRIRAVVAAAETPPVLCSWSAAAVWGMPVFDTWPDLVHVLGAPAAGGRSKNGVRRHPLARFDHVLGQRPSDAGVPIVEREGLLITGLAHTTVDVVLDSEFAPAVATVDWALARNNPVAIGSMDVEAELRRRAPRYRRSHAAAVIGCATRLSDSFGESMARAVMLQLGFPEPELQVKFTDIHGDMFVDYFWREQSIVGEFDGATKYLQAENYGTFSPSEVVWREKKRDDRLRRQVGTTVRIIWSDVRNPSALERMLREAGLRPERGRRRG
ncbi:type IV toxin-antitoxin system AbiEi family antitoxin domain-containing protein [Homoserinimonas hongtaonis]|uniref:AbiEi antitoxin C-terminal domain-containing protein n=1 Tax=Homoserinimonas hongtaonis TaxID=2079791 RepID=A0A2U1T2I3_9MICO|nr:type IV toxin-antitoxin system AbiEi family antitoxin domain-containing protein [Salinibacterium hongtaonis]PWB98089.1 hypothetical protein DF220_09820 [Salinibacterium hongtaonis]